MWCLMSLLLDFNCARMAIGKMDVAAAFLGVSAALSGAGCDGKSDGKCDSVSPIVDHTKPLSHCQLKGMDHAAMASYCDKRARGEAARWGSGEEVDTLVQDLLREKINGECLSALNETKGEK